jgi:hypothetical protein
MDSTTVSIFSKGTFLFNGALLPEYFTIKRQISLNHIFMCFEKWRITDQFMKHTEVYSWVYQLHL